MLATLPESGTTSVIRSVRAADGYPLQYRVWPAATGEVRATVVFLNGVMSHSGWFAPLAPALTAAGVPLGTRPPTSPAVDVQTEILSRLADRGSFRGRAP